MTKQIDWIPSEKNVEDYMLLKDMLHAQREEFNLLSKKKADGHLSKVKIRMFNRVIEPLKELFKQEEAHVFLDILDEDEMPTYSDVVLIISQYETAIIEFRKKYYFNDPNLGSEFSPEWRWITTEYPQNYYENMEDE